MFAAALSLLIGVRGSVFAAALTTKLTTQAKPPELEGLLRTEAASLQPSKDNASLEPLSPGPKINLGHFTTPIQKLVLIFAV